MERNRRLDGPLVWIISSLCSFCLLGERTSYSTHFSSHLPYCGIIQAIGAVVFSLGKGFDFWVRCLALGRDVLGAVQLGGSSASLVDGLAV